MKREREWAESELPAYELFQQMGYSVLEPATGPGSQTAERKSAHEVILRGRLEAAIARLNPGLNAQNRSKALDLLLRLPPSDSLLPTNQFVHRHLRKALFTAHQTEHGRDTYIPVSFLDYHNPANNDFTIGRQQRFSGQGGPITPDLVVYINGLPLAVIECKKPGAGRREAAIKDLQHYQEESFRLFAYKQICVALWGDGGSYGAIGSPEKFYHHFPSDPPPELAALRGDDLRPQDRMIWELFHPSRLIDFVRHFVIFEENTQGLVKKLPRWPQIRATNKAVRRLSTQQIGGVIWHTQGSGKSLTMAYITRKLRGPEFSFNNPTILVLTDRVDLDQQIADNFRWHDLPNVYRTNSVQNLQSLLRNDYGGIITTTIQKFQEERDSDWGEPDRENEAPRDEKRRERVRKTIDGKQITVGREVKMGDKWTEVARKVMAITELSQKENLFVMVDEAHRSQYSLLAASMRAQLPHAKFLAFTAPP